MNGFKAFGFLCLAASLKGTGADSGLSSGYSGSSGPSGYDGHSGSGGGYGRASSGYAATVDGGSSGYGAPASSGYGAPPPYQTVYVDDVDDDDDGLDLLPLLPLAALLPLLPLAAFLLFSDPVNVGKRKKRSALRGNSTEEMRQLELLSTYLSAYDVDIKGIDMQKDMIAKYLECGESSKTSFFTSCLERLMCIYNDRSAPITQTDRDFSGVVLQTVLKNNYLSTMYKRKLMSAGKQGHHYPGSCNMFECNQSLVEPTNNMKSPFSATTRLENKFLKRTPQNQD